MFGYYQHLPENINPIAFAIGSFEIRWYALMYLAAFAAVYALLALRIQKKEAKFDGDLILDWLLYSIGGLLIGARLGYVLFYNLAYFWQHPAAIISPFDLSGRYVGVSGMSYFGGLAVIILVSVVFTKKREVNFWQLADFVIPAIPAGYFFGRLGNFLNGELFGRVTDKAWGMYFTDGLLRHPSQLYEMFFEGLVIFAVLWIVRNKSSFPGQLLLSYLFLYGFFRFVIEFFRQPDPQIGLLFNFLTLGQIFSLVMLAGVGIIYFQQKGKMLKSRE